MNKQLYLECKKSHIRYRQQHFILDFSLYKSEHLGPLSCQAEASGQ